MQHTFTEQIGRGWSAESGANKTLTPAAQQAQCATTKPPEQTVEDLLNDRREHLEDQLRKIHQVLHCTPQFLLQLPVDVVRRFANEL
jgi:hypothetical protein